MRVLFYVESPPPNTGVRILNKTFIDLLEELVQIRHLRVSSGKEIKPKGEGIFRKVKHNLSKIRDVPKSLLKLGYTLEKSIDILYINGSHSLLGIIRNFIAVELGKQNNCRIIVHVHSGKLSKSPSNVLKKWIKKRIIKRVNKFVFSSSSLSKRAKNYIPRCKRAVVPNTLDEEVRCASREVISKIENKGRMGQLRVLYLSNMIESKGYEDVLDAVHFFDDTKSGNITVDFIGAWPSEEARRLFRQEIRNYGLEGVARVHGRLDDRSSIRQAYLDADVFVLPTYYPTEAQPVTIIEAMNAGTPIIATRHASIPEYITDDENGYLVEKKSPSQIMSRLNLLANTENWKSKARAARRTYEEIFSPGAVREKMLTVMRGSETK